MKKKLLAIFLGVLYLQQAAFALQWNGDLDVTAGYRSDTIETKIDVFSPNHTFIDVEVLKGQDISIATVGFKGWAEFCDRWFIKGFVDFGFVGSGDYQILITPPAPSLTTYDKGNIIGGYTQDFSFGLGYLFCFKNCYQIRPCVGYAYDGQEIKMGTVKENGVVRHVFDNLRYQMRWQGPWLGFEARFPIRGIDVNCGYEYHWSHWNADWLLNGFDLPGFAVSDKLRSNHAHGNVFFIDGSIPFCGNWNVGLGFRLQCWKAVDGTLNPRAGTFEEVGRGNIGSVKVTKATWNSCQVQFNIGCHF